MLPASYYYKIFLNNILNNDHSFICKVFSQETEQGFLAVVSTMSKDETRFLSATLTSPQCHLYGAP